LKSALEIREIKSDDILIRKWIRENDFDSKGFITIKDYRNIYKESVSAIPKKMEKQKLNTSEWKYSKSQRENQRLLLWKEAFEKYDTDCDGFLSYDDLKIAFAEQHCTEDEILSWISKRDLSGLGRVSFNDYMKHEKKEKNDDFDVNETKPSATHEDSLSSNIKFYDQINDKNKKKLNLLRDAFSKYDIDDDGYISQLDMKLATSGQNCSMDEIASWIKKRDLSGVGAVSFEDFVKHYNN
jgi:Ca2+-binding EF-hand superfamily protein